MALMTLLIVATKADMLEEVRRLKRENKEGMEKQEDLMASAKLLQGRIHSQNKVGIFSADFMCLLLLCFR